MEFYSYLWLREDGSPYYVGKGSGKRAYIRRENHWPPNDYARIVIFPQDSEADAFESEISLIALFGRKDLGTGILQNRSDGGDNPPKRQKGTFKWSEEGKQKLSALHLGKPILKARGLKRSEETIRNMSKPRSHSWVLSAETKQAQSEAAILREAKKKEQGLHRGQVFGYRHNEDAKRKMSEAKKGKPAWNKGLAQTPEHLAKLSAARKGKKWSAARRRRHEEKKNGKLQFSSERQHDDHASGHV